MIRPAYWSDADLQTRLTADCREFYIGLWMQADDAGYVAWDVDRLGAELYPYRSLGWRRSHLARWVEALGVNGHARLLDCGVHVVIPNLTRYQHAPKPSYPNQRAHEACMRSHEIPRGTTGDHGAPLRGFGVSKGVGRGVGRGLERGAPGANGASTDDESGALYSALGDRDLMPKGLVKP